MPYNDVSLTTCPEIRPSSLSICPFWRCFSLCLGRGESWNRGSVEIYVQLWKCMLWLRRKKKIIHTTQSQCKSHPASKKYEFKPVLFGWLTLLAAASCFLCMSHVAFSLCKIWNLSPGSCGWTQMLGREGWGASLYSDPLMEKFSNPSRWVCSIPKCLMAVHGEWLPALGFSCPESSPPGWALSILSSSAGLALSF